MPLHIVQNDITKMRVDAIVNGANCALQRGGGVCGAIFEAADNRALKKACDEIGSCATGCAVITPGFQLQAKYIIHTPGPVWAGGIADEAEKLTACYTNALSLAQEHDCSSIAFPLIASGIYGYPKEQAISVAVSAIGTYLLTHADIDAYLVLYGNDARTYGRRSFPGLARYIDAQYVASGEPEPRGGVGHASDDLSARTPTVTIPYSGTDDAWPCALEHAPLPTDAEEKKFLAQAREQAHWHEEQPLPELNHAGEYKRSGLPMPNPGEWLQRLKTRKSNTAAGSEASDAKPQVTAAKPEQSATGSEASDAKLYSAPHHGAGSLQAARRFDASIMPDDAYSYPAALSDAMAERRHYEMAEACFSAPTANNRRLSDVVRQLDESFSERVLRCIDENGWTDVEVYKRANLDRKLFSKIRSDPKYQPSKRTATALAIALRLNIDETRDLLQKAGYALSRSTLSDVIVAYFIEMEEYDIFKINLALYENGQALLSA